jgi:hypothetical protein
VATQQAKGTARGVAWFATFVCAITGVGLFAYALINQHSTVFGSMLLGLAPLLSVLPFVFFRIAREQGQMENQIRELRDRVELLEKVTTEHRSTPGEPT